MGIWWAAGFSTAAIRIIDDDARGTWNKVVGCEWWFANLPCLPSCERWRGLPMDGGDVQVNKFIRILRSERQIEMVSDRWDVVTSVEVFFPQQLELFVAFCKKVFECRGVARSPESATLMRIEDLIQGDISSSFDSTPQLSRLHDGLALAHTLSCIGLFIRWPLLVTGQA